MERINGFIVAPFTPFTKSGELNLPVIEDYYKLVVKNGIDGVFVCGTTGEGYSLTIDERKAVAEKWIDVAKGKIKVIVHTGTTGIENSKELAKHAQSAGAWGIATMNPVFFKPPGVEELVQYCKEIADSAPELPFYFYHIPVFTNDSYRVADFLEAADGRIPNLAGVKYTHADIYDFNQCKQFKNGKYEMLHGLDETLIAGLAFGAKGGVGGTYNHCFPLYKGIVKAFNAGDMEGARALQNKSQEFINILGKYRGNCSGGKRIMKFLGVDCGPNRLPLKTITDIEEKELNKDLEAIGFFDFCC
jgi:N-acetylneuraminate lyase